MISTVRSDFARGSTCHVILGANMHSNCIPAAIHPQTDSFSSVKWVSCCKRLVFCCKARKYHICRAHSAEKASEKATEKCPTVPDNVGNNHWRNQSNGDVQDYGTSFDRGWLPSLPHVLTTSLANFLFGYHIGIMNGPITSIARELGFKGEHLMEGLVVSIFILSAFFGSLSAGVLADRIGRRRTLQLDMLPLILGALLSAQATSADEMIIGRFLVGLGIGVNTVLVPVYISEVAPTKYRGSLGSICQLATCAGLIVALVLGMPCETDPHWWRAMFYMASVPGFLSIIGMQFTAESPRWLGKVGRWDEAKRVICQLWGDSQAESAIEEIKSVNKLDGNYEEAGWSELLTKRHYKAPAIGSTLFILQQFAGINGVLYFSSLTFGDVGITDTTIASIAVGVANFIGASIALYLMDKQGRQRLLLGSYLGMAIFMFLLVISLGAPIKEEMTHLLSVFGTLMYVLTFSLGAGPVTGLIISEMSSTGTRAKTMAFSLCVHWVCNFVIGLFFLDMVEKFGLRLVYASFGSVSLLAAVFTKFFVTETKGRSLEEIQFLLNPELEHRD